VSLLEREGTGEFVIKKRSETLCCRVWRFITSSLHHFITFVTFITQFAIAFMGGVRRTGSFTKLKVVIIENFVPELGATLCYLYFL